MSIKGLIQEYQALQKPVQEVLQVPAMNTLSPSVMNQITGLYAETVYFHNAVGTVLQQTGSKVTLLGSGKTEAVCAPHSDTDLSIPWQSQGDPNLYLPQTLKMLNTLYVKEGYTPGTLAGTSIQDQTIVDRNWERINRQTIGVRNVLADIETKGVLTAVQVREPLYRELSREKEGIVKMIERTSTTGTGTNSAVGLSISVKPGSGIAVTAKSNPTDDPITDLTAFHQKNLENDPAFVAPAQFSVDLAAFHGVNTGQAVRGKSVQTAWEALEGVVVQAAQELVTPDFKVATIPSGGVSWAARVDRTTALIELIGLQPTNLSPSVRHSFETTYQTFLTTYESERIDLKKKGPPLLPDTTYGPTSLTVVLTQNNENDNPTVPPPPPVFGEEETTPGSVLHETGGTGGGGTTVNEDDLTDPTTVSLQGTSIGLSGVRLQVGDLYLQARGSDNQDARTVANGKALDGTANGIHLRWTFRGALRRHLPKGKRYETTDGNLLNKKDDFVRLFRTPYENRAVTVWRPKDDLPTKGVKTAQGIVWFFENCQLLTDEGTVERGVNSVWVRFPDEELYDQELRKAYSIIRPLSFDEPVNTEPLTDPNAVAVPVYLPDVINIIQGYIKEKPIEIGVSGKLCFALGLEEVRGKIIQIEGVASYEEGGKPVLNCRKEYLLADDCEFDQVHLVAENIVYFRVKGELPPNFMMETYHDFIETRPEQAWENVISLNPDSGYDKEGLYIQKPVEVSTPLNRLRNNPMEARWPQYNEGYVTDYEQYHQYWKKDSIVATYLDKSRNDVEAVVVERSSDAQDQSTFPVKYTDLVLLMGLDFHFARLLGLGMTDFNVATKPVDKDFVYLATYEDYKGQDHLFMSLPTCRKDYRDPLQPEIGEFSFGTGKTLDDQLLRIDPEGYLEDQLQRLRFVNIHRQRYVYEVEVGDFFATPDQWNLIEETIPPVLFGLKYSHLKELQAPYPKPDLPNQQDEEADPSTSLQVKDLLNAQNLVPAPILLGEGGGSLFQHLQNEKATGENYYAFYAVNWFSCSSPVGSAKGLETKFKNPLRPIPPVNLTAWRVKEEPVLLMGYEGENTSYGGMLRLTFEWNREHYQKYQFADLIRAFYRFEAPFQVRGRVLSYRSEGEEIIISTGQTQEIRPDRIEAVPLQINPSDQARFVGGILSIGELSLEVLGVSSGTKPEIRVRIPRFVQTYPDTEGQGGMQGVVKTIRIPEGADFLLREQAELQESFWTHWENMFIEVPKPEPIAFQQSLTYNKETGYFSFPINTLSAYNLRREGVRLVEWYGGTVVLPALPSSSAPDQPYCFPIVRIQNNRNECLIECLDTSKILPDTYRNQMVSGIRVYPGLRAYLPLPEDILKKFEQQSGTVYLSLRAEDSTKPVEGGGVLTSLLSKSVFFQMEYVRKAETPPPPQAPTFATRPDTFGKSTFTLNLSYKEKESLPYGLQFYRADDNALLEAIYGEKASDLQEIRKALAAEAVEIKTGEQKEDYTVNRWKGLIHYLWSGEQVQYAPELPPEAYRFPQPTEDKVEIRQKLEKIFVPLSEQPLLTETLARERFTSRNKPAVVNEKDVRFTDYLLDGASRNLYFYFAKETDALGQWGDACEPVGPISLINSRPPEQPQIRRIIAIPNNEEQGPGVQIEINAYADWDDIGRYRLYRTTNPVNSLSPRLMVEVMDLEVTETSEAITLIDRFSDGVQIPYSDHLYYRVVADRLLKNELGQDEYIPSMPSEVVITSIPDALNPQPPVLIFSFPIRENDQVVELLWQPTVYKGKYLLYQMTAQGTWKLLTDNPLVSNETRELFHTVTIDRIDEQDRPIYHRFKVTVINASGLMNLREEILTI